MIAFAENSIQLVPDGTLLIHLVLVVVMVVVLNQTLLKPINRVLEERERRTGGKFNEAKELMATADEKARVWEQGLRKARNESYHLLESERVEALRDREERVAALKAELAEMVANEKSEIKQQEQQAQAELQAEARRLADLIGAKVLGRNLG
jgi:F-type H+-transporting ATPase subunit b